MKPPLGATSWKPIPRRRFRAAILAIVSVADPEFFSSIGKIGDGKRDVKPIDKNSIEAYPWAHSNQQGVCRMATSGPLIAEMSRALGMPLAAVATVQKALRGSLIRTTGRGPSAAAMSFADVSALLVGVMSGATFTQVPGVTGMLFDMPLRTKVPERRQGSFVFSNMPLNSTRFIDALIALLRGISASVDGPLWRRNLRPDVVRLAIGLSADRCEGFACIQERTTQTDTLRSYWCTSDFERGRRVQTGPGGIDLDLIEFQTDLILTAHITGRALIPLVRLL